MSDRPQGEGWWLASDGRWYPPESRPAPPPAPAPPWAYLPVSRLSTGLHTSLRVMMFVSAGLAALALLALANAIPRLPSYGGSPASWEGADGLWSAAAAVLGLSGLATGILLIIWSNQAYRSLNRTGASGRSWSSGWAVGGWFIPLASLIIPRLVFSEIERIAHPDNGPAPIVDRWKRHPLLGSGLAWWLLTCAAAVLGVVGGGMMGAATSAASYYEYVYIADERLYHTGMVVLAVGLGLGGVALLFGAAYFRRLGERLLDHSQPALGR